MPAYFSVQFELKKSKTVMRNFYTALLNSGLAFKSGYMEDENIPFDEIVKWNQSKLDENFELAFTQSCSDDYKHMLFCFSDFSETRVFVLNEKKASSFVFILIIPEDDFVEFVRSDDKLTVIRKNEKMELIKHLAKSMWNQLEILAIQTAWEISDCPPSAKKISKGAKPQIEPFCIISNLSAAQKTGFSYEIVSQKDVLIENTGGWNYI